MKRRILFVLAGIAGMSLSGCSTITSPVTSPVPANNLFDNFSQVTPASKAYRDLVNFPDPKGAIKVAVYGFRDQTGQYKPVPASNFSTAVTQGAASLLVKSLLDSKWFIPLEREGLQDLLTERKIIRAARKQKNIQDKLAALESSNIIMEGGIVAYETNVRTGGAGAKYFGIGGLGSYRTDQVTINLRAVDVRTGRVVGSVSTTKTIFSHEVGASVFRYIRFQRLLEVEIGYTINEPAQLAVSDAIEAAVVHLIVQGVERGLWSLKNDEDRQTPLYQAYLKEQQAQLTRQDVKQLEEVLEKRAPTEAKSVVPDLF